MIVSAGFTSKAAEHLIYSAKGLKSLKEQWFIYEPNHKTLVEILGNEQWQHKGDNYNLIGDPEGLLSTLPAVVSVLLGYFTGEWLRKQPIKSSTSMDLVLVGLSCLVVGEVWGFWFPINKKLWTSSYVIFTTGWALILLAACYEWIEVRSQHRWGKPFEIMGLNAIFVFVASVLMIKILVKTHIGIGEKAPSTYEWIYAHLFVPWVGARNGSLLFALITVLFWWLVLYGMYRQRWFIKI
jgi:predicted acyltransferase